MVMGLTRSSSGDGFDLWAFVLERYEAIKWLAIVSMVVDHVGALLIPELLVLRVVGRLAFPLFALLVGLNLARGVHPSRYVWMMAAFAVVSQVPYYLAFGGELHLNIFVTLLAGVVIVGCWRSQLPAGWVFVLPFTIVSDYGIFGALLIPAFAFAFHRARLVEFAVPFTFLGVAQGSLAFGLFAQVVFVVFLVLLPFLGRLPRVPSPVFWWFYPVHLLGFAVVRWVL
jgi:hypothetical protein